MLDFKRQQDFKERFTSQDEGIKVKVPFQLSDVNLNYLVKSILLGKTLR